MFKSLHGLKKTALLMGALVLAGTASPAFAAAEVGKPAPDFTATDISGKPFKLSEHKGKLVVLEWTNHQCPFVKKHYGSGNMQKVQKEAQALGAEWVSIVSSAPGREGHTTPEEAANIVKESGATITAKILDEKGEIGGLYGAQTTPHMFVVDAQGTLAYAGAIDDNASPDPKTVEGAKNYVIAALASLKNGQPVEVNLTQPYGCSVKY